MARRAPHDVADTDLANLQAPWELGVSTRRQIAWRGLAPVAAQAVSVSILR
jgi:hypothetical protein